jgi:alcohol dehydrogenase
MGLGATPFLAPLQFGHECVAEVLTAGSEVTVCRPGQRVVVPFQISCGACAACRAGRTGNCETVPPIAMYGFGLSGGHWGGAVADELAVPYADGMLVPLPQGIGRNATLIVARSHARALIPGVLALMADGKLAPERVTTVLAPMDDAAAALNDHLRGGSTKTIVAV